ncbi:RMD1 family protein [Desulfosporosinus sp. PR]|uniref:RMD1 family protein n=1 Tax=Candidatus Desulfosporosinus nitrosoreducens TaxID=3401928 RepID=UPI0027E5D77D|nr:RMD1 family protein [Desulfosporosinus sp. PR]MDQ7095395.1 RMD1 family protein [Desulfosporosinus sp. PR]
MEKIMLNTYKVSARLPLARVASFIDLGKDAGRREYLKFEGADVEKILKYASADKAVYLYKYGCITFLNFTQDEISIFCDYLGTLFIDLDYESLSKFNESHEMILARDGYVNLWEGDAEKFPYRQHVDDIAATILAKSTELYKIETELSEVLDEAGTFIIRLNKGYLRANSKKVAATLAQSIRFKYRSLESVRLLGRPSEFKKTIESRQIFDKMSEYFELKERYAVLLNQMDILDSITGEYLSFGSKQSERRLLLFEILLLASFPLLHLLR